MIGALPDSGSILRSVHLNGTTLLAYPNLTSPAVYFSGFMLPGSISDPAESRGLASFTTDMLMTGTKSLTFQKLHDKIESIGASLSLGSGHLSTSFHGQCLSEDLETVWNLLVEVAQRPSFTFKQFKRVRGQILTSLAVQNQDTTEMAHKAFNRAFYRAHPYAHPSMGNVQSVSGIKLDQLRAFHQSHYGPDGLVLAVCGGIDPENAQRIFARTFGMWQSSTPLENAELPTFTPPDSPFREHVPLAGKAQTDVILGVAAPTTLSRDFEVCSLGNKILGHYGMMGRIGRALREKNGLAYEVTSYLGMGLGPSTWMIEAGVNPENLDKAITVLRDEIQKFISEPVTNQELEDVKSQTLGKLPLSLETNAGIASTLVRIERFHYGLDHLRDLPAIISSITAPEILAAAQRYWNPDKLIITSAGKAL